MPTLIEAFHSEQVATRATRTATTYLRVATAFETWCGAPSPPTPTTAQVEGFLARPRPSGRRPAVATRNQELAAIRTLASFAKRRGYWPNDPAAEVPFLREPSRDPAVLSMGELQRFFRAAAEELDPVRRARDLCVLALLSQAGLRVHELVQLDAAQVDVASASLIAVRGKGGTLHDTPLNGPALALTIAWIAERMSLPDAKGARALFLSNGGTRITIRSVQRLLVRLRGRANTAKRISPHSLRHTTATLAILGGADLSAVADLLRHDDLNTTRRYLHLVDERRRDAVRRIASSVPPELLAGKAPDTETSPEIGKCMPGSSKNDEDKPDIVDVQYGLGDPKCQGAPSWQDVLSVVRSAVQLEFAWL